jgi:hypothetical protein
MKEIELYFRNVCVPFVIMFPAVASAIVALLALPNPTIAQFPATPVGRKVLESRFGEGVTITYKEVNPCSCPAQNMLMVRIELSL